MFYLLVQGRNFGRAVGMPQGLSSQTHSHRQRPGASPGSLIHGADKTLMAAEGGSFNGVCPWFGRISPNIAFNCLSEAEFCEYFAFMSSSSGKKTFPSPARGLSNGPATVRAPKKHPEHWFYQRAPLLRPRDAVAFRNLPQTSFSETFLFRDKLEPGFWKPICRQ